MSDRNILMMENGTEILFQMASIKINLEER